MAKTIVRQKDWKWKGLPGHFCCADQCIFRLCTVVGDFIVSTVGAMYRTKADGTRVLDTVGHERHYETFVFLNNGNDLCDISRGEIMTDYIYAGGVNSLNESWDRRAEDMHLKMCNKVSKINKESIDSYE